MKKLAVLALIIASPAAAHTGAAVHMHPHDGASWMIVASALGLIAVAGSMVAIKARAETRGRK